MEPLSQPVSQMSRLFVVATPIGNLRDITLRALDVLRTVSYIAAEDTRHTAKLLSHYEITTPTISYYEHNKHKQLPRILSLLVHGDIAVVSDAGTPGISDPGAELVLAASGKGHIVVPVPGPSALSTILSVTGLHPGPIHFLGFLPRKSKARRELIATYLDLAGLTVFFESPHRVQDSLRDIAAIAGMQQVILGRELTKHHEEIVRGPAATIAEHFDRNDPRGEFVLVLEGLGWSRNQSAVAETLVQALRDNDEVLAQRFAVLTETLGDRRKAMTQLATEAQQPRRKVYQRLHH